MLRRFAIALGLFFLALGIRLVGWQTIFQFDGIYPYGNDAFYHLRRIRHAVEAFPAFLSFDPLINFPHGAQAIWPPTLDWLVALCIRIGVGPGDTESLERWVMWMAPLLGAGTVVWVYFLGRRFFSTRSATLAAVLLAVMPAHFLYSQLGFADHHVVVALLSVGILWSGMRLFSDPIAAPHAADGRGLSDRRGIVHAAWLGLAMGATVLVWPGALIHVAIVQLAMIVRVLFCTDRGEAVRWAWRFAVAHVVMLVLVFPMSAGNEWARWGDFSPLVLSNFQPLYFASAALLFAVSAETWRRKSHCESSRVRAAWASLLGTMLAAALFGLIPELRAGASDSWSWFSLDERFQALVVESAPLFYSPTGFDGTDPAISLTWFLYLVPFFLLLFLRRDYPHGDRVFFLWWTAAFFVATLGQRRFMNTYSIAHALLMARSIFLVYDWGARSFEADPSRRLRWRLATLLGVCVLLLPVRLEYGPDIENLLRAARGEAPHLPETAARRRLVTGAARWLRAHSPEPIGPGYSVLGPWEDGHLIKYVAERATVQDNFGDDVSAENFDLADRYFASEDESEALEILDQTRTRFVLVRDAGSGQTDQYQPTSMLSRLYLMRGSSGRVHQPKRGRVVPVRALHRHRLVYESPRLNQGGPGPEAKSFAKLFEIVPGARVLGHAEPGAHVAVRLELRTRLGPFVYHTNGKADDSGRYSLRLPYSNEVFSPDVRAASSYTFASGEKTAFLSVPEAAVQGGLELEGPEF
jgi:asparagine N-glycosylation enzyme membrane subunit Stt3